MGPDDQIPFARIPDGAAQSNERDYGLSTFQDETNVESSALSLGYYFSDDPYAASDPLGVGSETLYTPKVAVGRLVESAAQIDSALSRFLASHGNLNATSSLTTGYSFLTGGAQVVSANLAADGLHSVGDLINDSWDTSDLDAALATGGNQVDSINAHFDYSRALPAEDDTDGTETDLFTTTDARALPQASEGTYVGSLLFSMGCHAGLDIDDAEVSISGLATPVDDWAKAFADSGSLWIANTGYGYADSSVLAYSAELMADFAGNLGGGLTIGEALSEAKQEYAAGNAILSPYDLKALMESTFYGIPMYHLNGSTSAGQPAPTSAGTLGTDPGTGLPSLGFSADGTQFSEQPGATSGSYYQAAEVAAGFQSGLQTTEYRPVEPLLSHPATEPGYVAHGALITSLSSSDTPDFTPEYSLPAVSTQDSSGPVIGDAAFPGTLQRVAAYDTFTPSGTATGARLDLVAGQFFPDPASPGKGTERLFGSIDGEILYQPSGAPLSTDFDPATIDDSEALTSGSASTGWSAGFQVHVTPSSQGDAVEKVLVLYTDAESPGTWSVLQLANPAGDGVTWTGNSGLPNADNVQFVVEALDAAGNVAVSNNEGADFDGTPQPAVVVSLSGSSLPDGSFTGAVTASISAPAGSTYVLDGSAPTAVPTGGQLEVGTVGSHILTVTGSDSPTDVVTRTFSISAVQTTVDLATSDPTGVVGEPLTFQATVAAVPPGAPPAGSVQFFDDTNPITSSGCGAGGPVALVAGLASCTVAFPVPTTGDQITATYLPAVESGFAASTTGSALVQPVSQAFTATSLAAAGPASPVVGQTESFVASVQASSPGSGTPTGQVEFLDGSAPIPSCGSAVGEPLQPATAPSAGSTVTCAITFTTGGDHVLSAVYFGDVSYGGSSSVGAPLIQNVGTVTPVATIRSTPGTVALGAPVTFTATVAGPAVPDSVVPSGSVTFYDSSTGQSLPCGTSMTVDLTDGTASCQTELLTVGSHQIDFTYSGDGNYSDVTSSAVSENVDQATTAVDLSRRPPPPVWGNRSPSPPPWPASTGRLSLQARCSSSTAPRPSSATGPRRRRALGRLRQLHHRFCRSGGSFGHRFVRWRQQLLFPPPPERSPRR